MKICVVSDLHGNLVQYPSDYWKGIEDCEVLFICGDIMPLRIQFDKEYSRDWLKNDFQTWTKSLPVNKVFFIGGNHDKYLRDNNQTMHILFNEFDKVTYLKHELIEYESIQDSKVYRIFGTPYCKQFGNWPFMIPDDKLKEKYSEIPENVDIFISHDAPDVQNLGFIEEGKYAGQNAGSKLLAEALLLKKPKYAFNGHIHSGDHNLFEYNKTRWANCNILDEYYQIKYNPLIIEV